MANYATTTQNLSLPATGALVVTLVDEASAPLAGKVSIVGFDPSPEPRNTQSIFGLINVNNALFTDFDADSAPFGVSKVEFFDQNGTIGPLPLEPGSYRVVVSHGPEYSIATQDVTVTAGATTSVNAQIARVVDSTGFVGSDFHVHSIESPDSRVARRDRVVTLLAEGARLLHAVRPRHPHQLPARHQRARRRQPARERPSAARSRASTTATSTPGR